MASSSIRMQPRGPRGLRGAVNQPRITGSFVEWRAADGSYLPAVNYQGPPGPIGSANLYRNKAHLEAAIVGGDAEYALLLGHYAPGDLGYARYKRVAEAPAHNGKIESANGAWFELAERVVNPFMLGAKGDRNFDDTTALNSTFAIGRTVHLIEPPVGYSISDTIHCHKPGQRVFGDGGTRSMLYVADDFNIGDPEDEGWEDHAIFDGSATQVDEAGDVVGPILEHFGIRIPQIDTDDREALIRFPTALRLRNTPRCKLNGLRIECAMVGIDARNNCGGLEMYGVEISALQKALWADGALDTMRATNCHVWGFGFGPRPNLLKIFEEDETVGFDIGRVDGFVLNGCLFICGTQLKVRPGAPANNPDGSLKTDVTALNCKFDSFNGIDMSSDGDLQLENCSSTLVHGRAVASIRHTGGTIQATNMRLGIGSISTPIISSGTAPRRLLIDGLQAFVGGADVSVVAITGENAILGIGGSSLFLVGPSAPRTKPVIDVPILNRASITARATDRGEPGVFIKCPNDDFHVIAHNSAPGWTYDLPDDPVTAIIGPNN